MRFLRPAMAALVIGACAPLALVAPGFAQTCECPPAAMGAAAVGGGPVIEADEAPPPLPEYEQPPMPEPGYTWTPGYWAWNNYDYYWVPGVWVPPPQPGLLWTPGYWAFVGGAYMFRHGYWAPHVGFYGGVNYGYGYNGLGYEGGRWENGRLFYNSTVNNFGAVRVANVYSQPVTVPPGVGRRSFNGGPGGILLKPTPEQERLATEDHVRATPLQVTQARTASMNAEQFQSTNKGKPPIAATPRAGDFKGPGAVPAKAAGTAETVPAPGQSAPPAPNAEQKGEEKLPAGEKPNKAPPLNPSKVEEKPAPGVAPVQPQPPNTPKVEEKKPPGGERPVKPEPLNQPKVEEKLPAGGKPVQPQPSNTPRVEEKKPLGGEKLVKPEPLNQPKVEEKLPAGGKPVQPQPSNTPRVEEKKPLGGEKLVKPEPLNQPKVEERQKLEEKKPPNGVEKQVRPELTPKTPERSAVPTLAPAAVKPVPPNLNAPKELPHAPAGAVQAKPPQPRLECGRPGLPPCPK